MAWRGYPMLVNLEKNRHLIWRRGRQIVIFLLALLSAYFLWSSSFIHSMIGEQVSIVVAILFVVAAITHLVQNEVRYMNNEYGLTLFSPGRGTLRQRSTLGAGRFLSLFELMTKFRNREGGIRFGRPIPAHRFFGLGRYCLVGPPDDRHLITVAANRSGKGTGALIPNLLTYPGSALVLDPKGELAQITAAKRGNGGGRVKHGLGQAVHVFDPEELVTNHPRSSWNPLSEVDLQDPNLVQRVGSICSALLPERLDSGSHDYFTKQARSLLECYILHAFEVEPLENHNLVFVRKLIRNADVELSSLYNGEMSAPEVDPSTIIPDPHDQLFHFMIFNQPNYTGSISDKIVGVAQSMLHADPGERSGIMKELDNATKFLDYRMFERSLTKSDFKLSDLKNSQTTVYICLSSLSLSESPRAIAFLFFYLALGEMERNKRKPRYSVLFAIDEFYSLGYMAPIERAMGFIAGSGVKLWLIMQHIGQLQALYPGTWDNFLRNCYAQQFFGDQKPENLDYLEKTIGQRYLKRKDGTEATSPLISAQELATNYFVRDSRRQIVLFAQEPAAQLELMDYYKFFPKSDYNDDDRSRPS